MIAAMRQIQKSCSSEKEAAQTSSSTLLSELLSILRQKSIWQILQENGSALQIIFFRFSA